MVWSDETIIDGERMADLAGDLRAFKLRKQSDGMARLSGAIGPSVVRAPMRFEAGLLLIMKHRGAAFCTPPAMELAAGGDEPLA
jgi:hypothetical protein